METSSRKNIHATAKTFLRQSSGPVSQRPQNILRLSATIPMHRGVPGFTGLSSTSPQDKRTGGKNTAQVDACERRSTRNERFARTWIRRPVPARRNASILFQSLCARQGARLGSGSTKAQLLKAMEGHVLGEGQLMGRYKRYTRLRLRLRLRLRRRKFLCTSKRNSAQPWEG